MNAACSTWRDRLSRIGIFLLLGNVGVYLLGMVLINCISHLEQKLKAGGWVFIVGESLCFLAAIFILFARGWKHKCLVLIALIEMFFFYGLTCY
jgi:biotin transporter BioY